MNGHPLANPQCRVLALVGICTPEQVDELVGLLFRLDAENQERIFLYISCRQGHALDGLRISDIMEVIRSPVTVIGMGLIEGPGLIAFFAAAERRLLPSAVLTGKGLVSIPILPLEPGFMGCIGKLDEVTPNFIENHVRIALTRLWSQRGILKTCRRFLNEEPVLMTAVEASQLGLAQIIPPGAIRNHAVPIQNPPPEPKK